MTDHTFPIDQPHTENQRITRMERAALLAAVLIISICALTYELIVATLSSYLLGNSVTQFSFTIGFFLFAMGIGALLSRQIQGNELRWLIVVEIIIGLFGGTSAVILYAVFARSGLSYVVMMALISLAIGICVGLEIPLLTRIVANRDNLNNALADILSVDYIGALVASLAFPVFLLPLLGVMLTAFLMGLFNLLVAGALLWMFRRRLGRGWRRGLALLTVCVTAVMVGGAVASDSVVGYFEQRLYLDFIIHREQTPYQNIVLTQDNEDTRLYLNGNLQFSSRDEHRYHETLVHPTMSAAQNHERVLILGGGDGMVAREVLKYDAVQEVIVVDLDPAITDLAREHRLLREFNDDALHDPRVTVVNTDAYTYVEDSSDLYPVVIIDLPDPNGEALSKLYSREFYTLLRDRLTPDGVFMTQATSPYFVRESYWMIVTTIEAAGFNVLPMHTYIPSFGEWGFVIGGVHTTPRISLPDESIPLRYLTEGVMQTLSVFDPDTDRIETGINTLDNPRLPLVYQQGWAQW